MRKILRTLLNVWDDVYVNGYYKVRNHCHITRKYRGSAHKDCNIKVKIKS